MAVFGKGRKREACQIEILMSDLVRTKTIVGSVGAPTDNPNKNNITVWVNLSYEPPCI